MIGPVVTDHALVRWLERVHGIDFSVFREEIAAAVAPALASGATGVVKDGFTYLLKGKAVVTVVSGRRGMIEDQSRYCGRQIAAETLP